MNEAYLKTIGMHCLQCTALIEMRVGALPGVASASSDMASGLTTVEYDPAVIDEVTIAEEIRECGFRARLVNFPTAHSTPAPSWGSVPSRAAQADAAGPGSDVHAVHFRTSGMHCGLCPLIIEHALAHVDGVIGVKAVRAMNLTSVLYDRARVRQETIAEQIRDAGFSAEVVDRRLP